MTHFTHPLPRVHQRGGVLAIHSWPRCNKRPQSHPVLYPGLFSPPYLPPTPAIYRQTSVGDVGLTHLYLHQMVLPLVTGLRHVELIHPVADAFLRLRVTLAFVVQICCGIVVWNLMMIYGAQHRIRVYHQGPPSIVRTYQRLRTPMYHRERQHLCPVCGLSVPADELNYPQKTEAVLLRFVPFLPPS